MTHINRIILLVTEGHQAEECCWNPNREIVIRVIADIKKEFSATEFDYFIHTGHQLPETAYSIITEQWKIPRERLMSYEHYVNCVREGIYYDGNIAASIRYFCQQNQWHTILDYDAMFANSSRYSRESLYDDDSLTIDAFLRQDAQIFPIYRNLYRKIITEAGNVFLYYYDLILLTRTDSIESVLHYFSSTFDQSEAVLLSGYQDDELIQYLRQEELQAIAEVQSFSHNNRVLLLIRKKNNQRIRLFVAAHKPFSVPPGLEAIYHVIHGGRIHAADLGMVGDDTGDNISLLNPVLNELTVLYWFWKNDTSDIVGLVHYRRYFMQGQEVLSEQNIRQLLKKVDVLVPSLWHYLGTNEEVIAFNIGDDLYDQVYELLRRMIHKYQPDYEVAYDYVLRHDGLYRCHMFITRRFVFDAYAKWLFSFLLPAAQGFVAEILPQAKTSAQKRALGFFAERMLTVWLLKQDLRIRELPIKEL